ncbi:MAG: 5-formyltetrahydrofolate cyclo-ligase [Deltaproteobacteria bacterium]|nr:5-formyltetrahydrofolate cyclo-ligase [Deltaproteobacteria bacterium]
MEELQKTKQEIRENIAENLAMLSESEHIEKLKAIENRLFEFANFLESNIVLLYVNNTNEVSTHSIIKKSFDISKIVVLPAFDPTKNEMNLMKIDAFPADLIPGPRNIIEPDPSRCKMVPIESIDIAIIPGVAFDERGGRIGSGEGYYDRLIPKLSVTTRKVALAMEDQIVSQVPIESHDKHVDIIITEKRIIYKI